MSRERFDEDGLSSEDLLALEGGALAPAARARVESEFRSRVARLDWVDDRPRARRHRRRRAVRWPSRASWIAAGLLALLFAVAKDERAIQRASKALSRGDVASAQADLGAVLGRTIEWSPDGSPYRASDSAHGPSALIVLEPSGLTFEPRPRFAWSAAVGSGPYDVVLEDELGETLLRASSDEPALEFPASAPDLTAGACYRVIVVDASGRAARARAAFTIATESEQASSRRELAEIDARLGGDRALRSLAAAASYARMHAFGAAQRELEDLERALPPKSADALREFVEAHAPPALLRALERSPPR